MRPRPLRAPRRTARSLSSVAILTLALVSSSAPYRPVAASELPVQTASNPADGAWVSISPPPSELPWRSVYDSRRNRMLMAADPLNVWAMDVANPGAWSLLETQSWPQNVHSFNGAAYDSVHDRVVLLGSDYQISLATQPPTWSPLGAASGALDYCAYAHDGVHNRVFVFGGLGQYCGPSCDPSTNETYVVELTDPVVVTHLTPAGTRPSKRTNAAGVYDPVRDRFIVYGGGGGSSTVHALSMSGTPTWSVITPVGSLPAMQRAVAWYDARLDRILILGVEGLWELTLSGAPTATMLGPYPYPDLISNGPSGILVPPDNAIITVGKVVREGEVLRLSLDGTPTWSEIVDHPWGAPFPTCTDYSTVVDSERDRLLVFGGFPYYAGRSNLWSLPLDAFSGWQELPTGPSRSAHTAVIDPGRDRLLVFGGQDRSVYKNDVWVLDLAGPPSWSLLTPLGTPPSARARHVATFDPIGDRMIVFGGDSSNIVRPDSLWELTFAGTPEWHRLPMMGEVATAYVQGGAVFDPLRQRMIYLSAYGPVYALELVGPPVWSQLTNWSMPYGSRLTYDPLRDRLLLDAGGTSELRLGSPPLTPRWLNPVGTPPTNRTYHGVGYDARRDRMVVLSGYGPPNSASIWWLLANGVNDVEHRPATNPVLMIRAYPNPASGPFTIQLTLERPGRARVMVVDVTGRTVRRLRDAWSGAGVSRVTWDGRNGQGTRVAPGVYLVRVDAVGGQGTRRIAVLD